MFDIGALELLLIVIVAVIVIGPKDMPQALRMAGKWVGKIRRASAQFRSGFDNLVREAEMEEMEKKWKEQNAKIMAETPEGEMGPLHESEIAEGAGGDVPLAASAEARSAEARSAEPGEPAGKSGATSPQTPSPDPDPVRKRTSVEKASEEPMLPLGKPGEG
ncbi:hypothetical protein GCM10023115_11540 [Pontixanthobacter gangjinensis]|uniref:Sec-independent protein translocase protein TatB n=1 Tax=Pontixanthobacter gangjinensis TaxID=1028742 RepID=A0A6I4SMQ5_9SPHN|nr:Sec-independent protein translocase protein TatB [Pontixanthobacter gangjinensis]MXO56400.1 twin-arginine translocase subunit TatB [Pontixanthobacter gangjinensis]